MTSSRIWRAICIIVFLTGMLGGAAQAQAASPTIQPPDQASQANPAIKIIPPDKVDVSPALSAVQAMQSSSPDKRRTIPLGALPRSAEKGANAATQPDMALQNAPVTGNMPEAALNFDGTYNTYGIAPPDTDGDIGPEHYVQWVNLGIQIWKIDRVKGTATSVLGPIHGNAVWDGYGGPCENDNDGDPIVLYDQLANRWMISQFAVTGGFYQCVAVSTTSDPTGSWYRYAYPWGDKMNDYPKFGVWPDGYYMTVNQFSGNSWAGAGIGVFEREKMLAGQPARLIQVDLYDIDDRFGGMLPADLDGNPPPTGTPAYFAEVDDSSNGLGTVDELRIWEARVNWDPASPSLTLGQTDDYGQPNAVLPVENFNVMCSTTRDCIPQPGTPQKIDAIGDRLMFRLAYRYFPGAQPYGAMVVNHTVDAGGQAGIRWYEIRRTGSAYAIHQQGTYSGTNPGSDWLHRWMGSIAMDWQGNMALGYSLTNEYVYPSIGYTGRLATDPLNVLPRGERIIFTGAASQVGVNRWGDYSSMTVDPLDECTFWYTQEYTRGLWDWATRIVSFKMPTCTAQQHGALTGKVTGSGGKGVAGATVIAGGYTAITGADGSYSFPRVAAGSYNMQVKAYGYQPASASGVAVTNGATSTRNFVLTPLAAAVLTVRLTDGSGHTGMPLYGWVDISSDYSSTRRYFTNPVTGQVAINLYQNTQYYLAASAESYLSEDRTATYTSAAPSEAFALLPGAAQTCPPGYTGPVEMSFEGFESGQVPPAGWYEYQLGAAGSGFTTSTMAYQGGTSAFHNDDDLTTSSHDLLVMRIEGITEHTLLTFYEQDNYSSWYVYHGIWVTTGADPNPLVSTYSELTELAPQAEDAWRLRSVDLSAYAGEDLYLAFRYHGDYADEWWIDNVAVIENICQALPGGRVTGFVTDAQNGNPLVGAQVSSPSATTSSVSTPADANIPDGFYNLWAPAGGASISASMPQYKTETAAVTLAADGVTRRDFTLSAAELSVNPATLSVTVAEGAGAQNRSLAINNTGAVDLDFAIREYYQTSEPVISKTPTGPFASNHRHVGPKNLNLPNLEGVVSYMGPVPGPLSPNKAATSWNSNLVYPWGIGFNTTAGDLWLGNIAAGGGDNNNYRFTTAGVNTSDTISVAPWVGSFGADMAYNPYTRMLWQVNVGGDNCIHEMDPATKSSTGRVICPNFGTSQRGLAYDPITDTYYAGSWNDGVINHFDSRGVILDSKDVGLNIAGLAYNPASGLLYASDNNLTNTDIFVLDTRAGYNIVDSFIITGLNGSKEGLEFDCDGQLWVVSSPSVFETEPLASGVCASLDIPWLTVSPGEGTIAPGGSENLNVTFDPTGLVPGVYTGYLGLFDNTPYDPKVVKVMLTITGYNASLSPETVTGKAAAGSQVKRTLTVTNTGSQADSYTISVSGNNWPTTMLPVTVGPLNPGQSASVVVTVQVPANAQGQTDTATVKLISTGKPTVQKTASVVTQVSDYSLTLTPASAEKRGKPGETFTYQLKLRNTGQNEDAYHLTLTGNAWTSELPLGDTIGPLPAGAEVTVLVTVLIGDDGAHSDTVTLRIESMNESLAVGQAVLTTSVDSYNIYLPILIR